MEDFLLAMSVYIMEYRPLAALTIVITLTFLALILLKKFNNKVRAAMHVFFAILSFYPMLLLAYAIGRGMSNTESLHARALAYFGFTDFPPGLIGEPVTPPWPIQLTFYLLLFALTIIIPILWIWDIRKKGTVYDYSNVPRWQKYLTIFLVFYGISYIHAMMYGVVLGGVPELFLMFGLYPCPINLTLVALLAPLTPNKVYKPLYIAVCIMAILGAFYNQMIGISVNLDAMSVTPVGIYGLVVLWWRSRKKPAVTQ